MLEINEYLQYKHCWYRKTDHRWWLKDDFPQMEVNIKKFSAWNKINKTIFDLLFSTKVMRPKQRICAKLMTSYTAISCDVIKFGFDFASFLFTVCFWVYFPGFCSSTLAHFSFLSPWFNFVFNGVVLTIISAFFLLVSV